MLQTHYLIVSEMPCLYLMLCLFHTMACFMCYSSGDHILGDTTFMFYGALMPQWK